MLICLFVCVAGCQPGKSQAANSDLPWPDSSNVGSVFKAFASVFTLALFLLWSLFSWFSGQKAGALISLICHANPVTASVSGARLPEATQRWRAGRVCSQLLQPQLLWSERSVPSLPNFRNLLVVSAITVLLSLSLAQYFPVSRGRRRGEIQGSPLLSPTFPFLLPELETRGFSWSSVCPHLVLGFPWVQARQNQQEKMANSPQVW